MHVQGDATISLSSVLHVPFVSALSTGILHRVSRRPSAIACCRGQVLHLLLDVPRITTIVLLRLTPT